MVVSKKKKVTKYRASVTHGGGHRKKRRGAGSRGGRGNAGSGKRAGQKVAGLTRKLGSIGFTSHARNEVNAVNLSYFTIKQLESLVSAGKVSKDGDSYTIDFKNLGLNKLLGSGSAAARLNVVVEKFSSKAEEKITSAGGSISIPEGKPETVETVKEA